MKNIDVLFLAHSSVEVKTFYPVYKKLKEKYRSLETLALSLEPLAFERNASQLMRKLKIPFKTLGDFPTNNSVDILLKLKPKIIVICGDDTNAIYQAFIKAAKKNQIKTLLIQEGVIGNMDISYRKLSAIMIYLYRWKGFTKHYFFLFNSLRRAGYTIFWIIKFMLKDILKKLVQWNIYGCGDCDKLAIAGEFTKDILVKRGISPSKIELCGLSRFDEIFNTNFDKTISCKKLGMDLARPKILLLTDALVEHGLWSNKQLKEFFRKIVTVVSEFNDIDFIVKLHPRESVDIYQQVLKEVNKHFPIYQDITLYYELINISDIVMTCLSTTALEAIIFKKPVIILNFFNGKKEYIPYVSEGVAYEAKNEEELRNLLKEILLKKKYISPLKYDKFVKKHVYALDGKATDRIVSIIIKMLGEDKNER